MCALRMVWFSVWMGPNTHLESCWTLCFSSFWRKDVSFHLCLDSHFDVRFKLDFNPPQICSATWCAPVNFYRVIKWNHLWAALNAALLFFMCFLCVHPTMKPVHTFKEDLELGLANMFFKVWKWVWTKTGNNSENARFSIPSNESMNWMMNTIISSTRHQNKTMLRGNSDGGTARCQGTLMQSGPGLSSQAAKQGLGGSVRGLAVSDLQIVAFGVWLHGEL